jgi:hypothetical protein
MNGERGHGLSPPLIQESCTLDKSKPRREISLLKSNGEIPLLGFSLVYEYIKYSQS